MNKALVVVAATMLFALCLPIIAQTIEPKPDGDGGVPPDDKSLINDLQDAMGNEVVQIGDKWIGVLCREVNPALRAHLDIPANAGMMVDEVIDNSPAAKAGLERFDILVEVDGEQLSSTAQLVERVSEAGDDGLQLTWLRRGQRMQAAVLPAERPEEMRGGWVPRPEAGNQNFDRLRQFFEEAQPGNNQDGPLNFRFWGPAQRMQLKQQMPANLSIQVNRSGNEPAKIKVSRGDDSWELTEDNLDQLPDDVRPHVENVLGGGGSQWNFQHRPPGDFGRFFDEKQWPRMNQEFEKIREQMDKMMEELQELRERQPQVDEEDTIDA